MGQTITNATPIESDLRDRKPKVGDLVPKAGIYTEPGVITKIENGEIEVSTDKKAIQDLHGHAITTGLSLEEKLKFNSIMDEVMKMNTNGEKLNALQNTIDQLKLDPVNKKITGALHNQQAVLIRLTKELPRVYHIAENKLQN